MSNRIPELTKKPEEKFAIGFQYVSPDLEENEYLTACTVSISPADGLEVDGDPEIKPTKVTQMIKSGTNGNEYYVKFETTTSAGHIFVDSIFVKVRE